MTDIHGGVEETHCTYILRDHDSDKLAARGETMQLSLIHIWDRKGGLTAQLATMQKG